DTDHRTDAEVLGTSLVFTGLLPAEVRAASPAVLATPCGGRAPGPRGSNPKGPERAGSPAGRPAPRARSPAAQPTPSRTSPSAMRARTRSGWEAACPRRPSGSTRPAAASTSSPTRGAVSANPTAGHG